MASFHGNPIPIVINGLILYYDVGNPRSYPGSGTTLTDLSVNKFNGTLTNGVAYDSSDGGSLVYDGVNDYVTANSELDPIAYGLFANINSSWTVSSWFSPDITNTNLGIIAGKGTSLTNGTFLLYAEGSNLRARLRGGTILDITTSLTASMHEAAITWDGTTAKAYYDGAYIADINIGSAAKNLISFTIGEINDISTSRYKGKVSQTKVYNRALSSTEVQQNYDAIKHRYGI
jgi:hypothetical protein